jgi:hypothetical protein
VEQTMPDVSWNVLGALFIATLLLAGHPISPGAADRFEQQVAYNWQGLLQDCSNGNDNSCMMSLPRP